MKKSVFTLVLGILLIGSMNVYAIYNTNMVYANPPLPEPVTLMIIGIGLFSLAGYVKKFKTLKPAKIARDRIRP